MGETWIVIVTLAVGTFSIRAAGFVLGARLPTSGAWARAFEALPGCLIASLLTVLLVQGAPDEWAAAVAALVVAAITRSLPLTMLAGIATVWALRTIV